ncbi:MAG: tRNA pseudouridine(55) synthase TruB [Candidatus Aminicenantes bacterium]|nr:tRNA pseudouridine(55) synthase TruB [Candidatus Aminicenantes bacterium]
MPDGILLVDKPAGRTSHDIVLELRRRLGFSKIGHFGTLDPLATGLLIAALGRATRLFPFFQRHDKTYEARVRLGFSTDTYDALGKPTSPVSAALPEEEDVRTALERFRGVQDQVPPAYSAKKYKGRPLYEMARKSEPVPLKASTVVIHELALTAYNPPLVELRVRCSAGTYVRSLAHDLGLALGCRAHLAGLVRTAVGPYTLDRCLTLDALRATALAPSFGGDPAGLIPMEALLPEFPKLILNENGARSARNGNAVLPEHIGSAVPASLPAPDPDRGEVLYRLFAPEGSLLALARRDPEKAVLRPVVVLS